MVPKKVAMAALSNSAPPQARNTISGGILRSDANSTVASWVLSPNSARNTVTNIASRSLIEKPRLLLITDLHHQGPLREGVEEEVFVIIEIVYAQRDAPILIHLIAGAGIDHEIPGEALISLGNEIAIVDGSEAAIGIA